MGSLAREMSGFQLWIKPLSPQGGAKAASFFVVALNTNDDTPLDIPMVFSDWYRGDFAPAQFDRAKVSDLWHVPPKELGDPVLFVLVEADAAPRSAAGGNAARGCRSPTDQSPHLVPALNLAPRPGGVL